MLVHVYERHDKVGFSVTLRYKQITVNQVGLARSTLKDVTEQWNPPSLSFYLFAMNLIWMTILILVLPRT
jgi:hypothetical protein